MGSNLKKQFFSFTGIEEREKLIELKLEAVAIEKALSVNSKRTINIDPAYLELPKLVVASSKNFSHRIYIGQGVFGDVQLQYQQGRFVASEWTYPDYQTVESLAFFMDLRRNYATELKRL